jgi:hypothetical protein
VSMAIFTTAPVWCANAPEFGTGRFGFPFGSGRCDFSGFDDDVVPGKLAKDAVCEYSQAV